MGEVTVDDATLFLAKFANGAVGTFEATRFAGGGKNGLRFEINGSEGSIRFNLERLNEIEYYSMKDKPEYQGLQEHHGHRRARSPTSGAWWPGGHIIGWQHTFVHQVYNLMNGIADGRNPSPSFADGLRCQEVLEAVEKSDKLGMGESAESGGPTVRLMAVSDFQSPTRIAYAISESGCFGESFADAACDIMCLRAAPSAIQAALYICYTPCLPLNNVSGRCFHGGFANARCSSCNCDVVGIGCEGDSRRGHAGSRQGRYLCRECGGQRTCGLSWRAASPIMAAC